MAVTARNLKPCYLVAFRCSVHGGIRYSRTPEEIDVSETGREQSTWETKRVVDNRKEYAEALSLRGKFKRAVESLGVSSVIGVIVPTHRGDEIAEVTRQYREKIEAFNAKASYSNMVANVLKFKIKGDNEQALESMLGDLNRTLGELRTALEAADYKGIREVLKRMKGYTAILPDNAASNLQDAIDDARTQARQIKRALVKKGEELSEVQAAVSTSSVDLARFVLVSADSDEDEDDGSEARDEAARALGASSGARAVAAFFSGNEDEDEDDAPAETAPAPVPPAAEATPPVSDPSLGA